MAGRSISHGRRLRSGSWLGVRDASPWIIWCAASFGCRSVFDGQVEKGSWTCIVVRPAKSSDLPDLLRAVVELQEYERELHETRLPGEQIAHAYTRWMLSNAEGGDGLVLVAQDRNEFVGFVAGWIEHEENVAQTADSNRYGFISDICILSK